MSAAVSSTSNMDELASYHLFTSSRAVGHAPDPVTRILEIRRLRQSLELLQRNRQQDYLHPRMPLLNSRSIGVDNIPPSLRQLAAHAMLSRDSDLLSATLAHSLRTLNHYIVPSRGMPAVSTSDTPNREEIVEGNRQIQPGADDVAAASLMQLRLNHGGDQSNPQVTKVIPPSFSQNAPATRLSSARASSPQDSSRETNKTLPGEFARRSEVGHISPMRGSKTNKRADTKMTASTADSSLPATTSTIESDDARDPVASGRSHYDSTTNASTKPATLSRPVASSHTSIEGSDAEVSSPQAKNKKARSGVGARIKTNAQWNAMFKRLLAYKAEHGNCLCPQRYKKDPKLGKWVSYQRKCKDDLSQERRQKLEAVGFVFTARHGVESWEAMFHKLVQYKDTHGHCLVPQTYRQDKKLGKWVAIQRNCKKDLTKERLKLLNDIGFVWSANQAMWDTMFLSLIEFKRVHGHLRPSWNRDKQLAHWLQRQRKVKVSEERLSRLREIGLDI